MKNANELLNFNFTAISMKKAADALFTPYTMRLLDINIAKLKQMHVELGEMEGNVENSVKNHIPVVFKKFKSGIKSGKLPSFDKKELRALSLSLYYSEKNLKSIYSESEELEDLFLLFDSDWRDVYLYGIIDCYLYNWNTGNASSFKLLNEFGFKKLRQYSGTRSLIKSFKENAKFFDPINGEVLLGSELAIRQKPLTETTKYLSLPDSWFSYSYFSKVFLAYYEKRKKDIPLFLDDMLAALNKHNNTPTTKRITSKLIIQANTADYFHLQNKVKNIAFDLIGDPGIASNWNAFYGATESEKMEIKNAHNILNEWLTKEFINVFFKECINDPARKKFWLKYLREINRFRVVGSSAIKENLKHIESISKYVEPRFCETNSSSDNNAALMFVMKNYLFIEFSDTGSFYAYKLSNPHAPTIEIKEIQTTSQLKITSYRKLVYWAGDEITEINDEGKLGHHENWEKYAQYWIKIKLGINV